MASIYKPKDKNHLYISYIDPQTGKPKSMSTGLLDTPANRKIAKEKKKEVEDVIKKEADELIEFNRSKATIKQAFEHFKKINHDKSEKTINEYDRFYVKLLDKFNANDPPTVIYKITAEEWIIDIKNMNYQKNTIYGIVKVFQKFLNFLFEYEYTPIFKINKDIKPKMEVKEIIVFSDEDVKTMLDNLDSLKKTTNFKTMLYMLVYTGLRPSDIINVKCEDIDLNKMGMRYYSPKTQTYYNVPLSNKLKPVLKERFKEVGEGRIFSYSTIGEMGKAFRRYIGDKKIKLDGKGYNLRTFRKNFATKAYESGLSIVDTMALLGHKNISTTQKYYTRANREKLRESVGKISFTKGSKKGVKNSKEKQNKDKKKPVNSSKTQ